MDFPGIGEFDVKGKTVVVRSDIEVPDGSKIGNHPKIGEAAATIRELAERGAKVVVLGHQGAPGEPGFRPLAEHAAALSVPVKRKVGYLDDVIGSDTLRRIKIMASGDVVLLENLHFLAEEMFTGGSATPIFVQRLASVADIFVNDAFALSHLSHASLVGFCALLPSAAGRLMERELAGVRRIVEGARPSTFVAGGENTSDCIGIIRNVLEQDIFERILTCGVVGELFLMAKGYELGKPTQDYLEKKGFMNSLPEIRALSQRYGERIETPVDCAILVNGSRKEVGVQDLPETEMLQDIGSETAGRYAGIVRDSKTVAIKGPAGMFGFPEFALGTKVVLEAVLPKSASLVFGNDTLLAAGKFNVINRFSHASFAEKALVAYLSGKAMPALEALKAGSRRKAR